MVTMHTLALHPVIRSEEACYRSSALAVQLARETNARLHIMHISTAKELSLFLQSTFGREAYYRRSVCVSSNFYRRRLSDLRARIKCNPAIKTAEDRKALQGEQKGFYRRIGPTMPPPPEKKRR